MKRAEQQHLEGDQDGRGGDQEGQGLVEGRNDQASADE